MDINGISSQSGYVKATPAPRPSFSDISASSNSQLVSQLPTAGSGFSQGIGLSLDIYDIVGKQSLGLLTTGGRSAMQIANISLGKDMSEKPKWNSEEAAIPTEEPKPTTTPTPVAPKPSIMDKILTESGYVAPAADPYVVQKDFFAS
jgi:hypothetical protein